MQEYIVFWESVDGRPHTDYFVTLSSPYAGYDVSYVHKSNNPTVNVREFIKTLPLNGLRIMTIDEPRTSDEDFGGSDLVLIISEDW